MGAATPALSVPTPLNEMDTCGQLEQDNGDNTTPRVRVTTKNPIHGVVEGARRGSEIICQFPTDR